MENDASAPAAAPRPQPGVIKTIGILNVLFGGLLLLAGFGCLKATAPAIMGKVPVVLTPEMMQAVFDGIRSQRIEFLQAQERAAASEEKKETVREALRRVKASHPQAKKEIDFAKLNAGVAWILRYLKIDFLTGPLVNLLMVIAGIGLVLRSNWGRLLAMATAAAKIVRLIVLFVLLVGFLVPQVTSILATLLETEMGREIVAQAVEQQPEWQKAGAAGKPLSPADVAAMFGGYSYVVAIFFVCLGSIYPAIALILLARPGARAACTGGVPPLEEFA